MMLPKVESVPVSDTDRHGTYHVEPLETGFGQTLGNALRRVLLSSLPGAAVTSIRIDNVYHEFSAIPDIKEDTTDLILNIKQVRLRSFSDRPVQCRLEAAGGGLVTAADIICPPDVEIVNPEQVLATLDGADSHLSMELTVERGRGYVPADHREGLPIGVIPVDAIYTPIRRVNFQVEPTRVGQVTDYERLVLDVWTDGTITPDEAVSQASQILVRHLNLLIDLVAKPAGRQEKQQIGAITIPTKLYDTPIEDLDLSVRAYNCLKRAGITKVGQVLEMTEDDLLGVRNFGRKSLDELRERLASRGLLEHSRLAAPTASEEEEATPTAEEAEEGEEGEIQEPAEGPEFEEEGSADDEEDEEFEEELDEEPDEESEEESFEPKAAEGEEPYEQESYEPEGFEDYDYDDEEEERGSRKRRRGKESKR